jgi:hypothetical protein
MHQLASNGSLTSNAMVYRNIKNTSTNHAAKHATSALTIDVCGTANCSHLPPLGSAAALRLRSCTVLHAGPATAVVLPSARAAGQLAGNTVLAAEAEDVAAATAAVLLLGCTAERLSGSTIVPVGLAVGAAAAPLGCAAG